jgi:hypothetical protein
MARERHGGGGEHIEARIIAVMRQNERPAAALGNHARHLSVNGLTVSMKLSAAAAGEDIGRGRGRA